MIYNFRHNHICQPNVLSLSNSTLLKPDTTLKFFHLNPKKILSKSFRKGLRFNLKKHLKVTKWASSYSSSGLVFSVLSSKALLTTILFLLLSYSFNTQALSATISNTIQGTRPLITTPSSPSLISSCDLDVAMPAVAGQLTTGDIIRLTYDSQDSDGDIDDSLSSIKWFCIRTGTTTYFTSSDYIVFPTLTPGGQAYSELTLPGASLGCTIGVEVIELTIYGDPKQGNKIKVNDVGTNTSGGTPTPPGPVKPRAGLLQGIYLSTDISYANNYLDTATDLLVGNSYVFVVWEDLDGDGQFNPTTDKDVTSYLSSTEWFYAGTPLTGNPAPSPTISTGTSGLTFTIPGNNIAATNAGYTATTMPHGAQGYYLRVKYQ